MIRVVIDTALGRAKLQRLLEVVDTPTMLNTVRLRLLAWVDQNIHDEGTEVPWPALRPSTVMMQAGPGGKSRQVGGQVASWRQKITARVLGNEVWVGFADEIQKLAAFRHFGTPPHVIEAKNAKVLAALIPGGMRASFLGPVGHGAMGTYLIFGKKVNHPGTPPRPLIPSERLTRSLVVDTLNALLAKGMST